jgi:2-hydroxy-4-carboxymuconate semialdehyde hemiacetal dehydrogenase
MRLAFIGYGSIAQEHARAFRQIPGVEVTWVVGRDPDGTEAFAREWGIPHWTLEPEEALASEVEGVVITSPSDLHMQHAFLALEAGKHALVEIPLATKLEDAVFIWREARDAGLRVQVAHTQRYDPALRELHRRIGAGELLPHHLVFRWFFLRRENVNWKGRKRTWTDNLLWHHGCHAVDAALWLLGAASPDDQIPEAEDVRCQDGPLHPELGIPLDLDIQFRAGARLVNIAMSYNSPWPQHTYCVIGEEATVEFREGKLWGPVGPVFEPETTGRSIFEQDLEWVNAVREDREPAVDPESVLPAMRALHAAWRSSRGRGAEEA